ncbi:MAG: hypothetical protein ACRDRL_03100 [Sciscionella sp.]
MNKVEIDENSNGTYNVTLPTGSQSVSLPPQDVVKYLKNAEQELQKALDDIKARREEFEKT